MRGLCDRNSVCLFVHLSHSRTVSTSLDLRSWFLHHNYGSPVILVSADSRPRSSQNSKCFQRVFCFVMKSKTLKGFSYVTYRIFFIKRYSGVVKRPAFGSEKQESRYTSNILTSSMKYMSSLDILIFSILGSNCLYCLPLHLNVKT